jgi:hypothetical protein
MLVMKNLTIVSIAISLLVGACIRKECRDIAGGYIFEVPVTLKPTDDTIRIGDTLSISSRFTNNVFEQNTQDSFLLDDFKFFPSVAIYKIDENPANEDGLANFEHLISDEFNFDYQRFSQGASGLLGEYTYNGEQYWLEFLLVADSVGLYYLEYGISPDLISQDFMNKCRNVSITTGSVSLNRGEDGNISLLERSPDTHYSQWILQNPSERFYKFGGYCFYVVE